MTNISLYRRWNFKKTNIRYSKQVFTYSSWFYPKLSADGILWSLFKFNSFGVSSFYINNKIDEGKILSRQNLDIKNFELILDKNAKTRPTIIYIFIYRSFIKDISPKKNYK